MGCRGQRAKPLNVDPGLYRSTKQDIWWVTQKRELPTAFKLFTGELNSDPAIATAKEVEGEVDYFPCDNTQVCDVALQGLRGWG